MVLLYSSLSLIAILLSFLSAASSAGSTKSHVDTIDITGFAKCGLTTRWFTTQFEPFLKRFPVLPAGLNITYHPLSSGFKKENGSKVAVCESGWLECQLSKLQSCSKKYSKNGSSTKLLLQLACIQNKASLEKGIECLPKDKISERIEKCVKSDEGEKLFLAEPFPHNGSISLPWIKINGVRSWEATKNFKNVVCGLASMKSKPGCL